MVIPKNSKRDKIRVFKPKYRRKVIYNQYRSSLGEIFHRLCSYKGVEIIDGHLIPDHVHMLVSISSFIGYLKGKRALMMFEKQVQVWESVFWGRRLLLKHK